MSSRMDKYYEKNDVETTTMPSRRTKRNEELYQKIYEGVEYSNVEGITEIKTSREIDINKIRELLNVDNIKTEKEEAPLKKIDLHEEEEREYDLGEILKDAKYAKKEDFKQRSLDDKHYDFIDELDAKTPKIKPEEDEDDLKHLISTITSSKTLEGLEDKELGLGILNNLKGSEKTEKVVKISNSEIESIIEKTREKRVEAPKENTNKLDESFYTSSFNFKEGDFEGAHHINAELQRRNAILKVMIYTLLGIIAIFIGYILFNLIK